MAAFVADLHKIQHLAIYARPVNNNAASPQVRPIVNEHHGGDAVNQPSSMAVKVDSPTLLESLRHLDLYYLRKEPQEEGARIRLR